jgi:hypothetical protein
MNGAAITPRRTQRTLYGRHIMAKGMGHQKNTKKKAAKTLMEKRAAKAAKKGG